MLIRDTDWARLTVDAPLPSIRHLAQLSWSEVIALAGVEGKEDVSSPPGSPIQSRFGDRLLATDPFLSAEDTRTLLHPETWASGDSPARLVDAAEANPITLVLDDPFVQVAPFARVGAAFGLLFSPGIVIVPA